VTRRRLFAVLALLALLPVLAACPATAPRTTAAVTPVAPPKMQAHDLIGVDSDGLAGLLGEPDFRRLDPPAELWQYRIEDCMLDVFLYLDEARGGAYAVTHVAARGRAGTDGETSITGDACIASIDVPAAN
jgi:hypothetical protein